MILITGGAGFIGSHLVESLSNDDVIVIDNLNDDYNPSIKRQNIANKSYDRFYEKDINDCEDVFKWNQVDTIIHLAAKAGVRPSIERPQDYIYNNINGTLNILEMARKYDVKKFIFSSSSSVYGTNKNIPFKETDPCNNIISPYAASKLSCESLCHTYSNLYDIPTVIFRFFTVYGPRQRPDMAFNKFTRLLKNNKTIKDYGNLDTYRDYTYVSDIVSGILLSLKHNTSFDIFNLGCGEVIKLRDAINIIADLLNKKPSFIKSETPLGDVPITSSDLSKAKDKLNYQPKTSLGEGLKEMIK